MCSYNSARRSRATQLAEHRHEPRRRCAAVCRTDVDERHRRHRHPRDRRRRVARHRARLHRPHHAIDQVAGEVRRHEADHRDDRRRAHAEHHLPAVRREVPEQPERDRRLAPGDERLRVAHRARDRVRVHAVGVVRRDRAAVERLVEHEPDVLERAALPLRVAHDGERRLVRRADNTSVFALSPGDSCTAWICARSIDRTSQSPFVRGERCATRRGPNATHDSREPERLRRGRPSRRAGPARCPSRARSARVRRRQLARLSDVPADDFAIYD